MSGASARRAARWSLHRRLATLLGAAGALMLALVVFAAVLLAQVQSQQRRVVGDYFSAVSLSNQLFVDMLDAETAVRGYALTGDPAALQPLKATQSPETARKSQQLQRLLADSPKLKAALDRAGKSAGTWFTTWAQPLLARVQHGGPSAVSPADIQRGKALFDQVRKDYDAYLSTVNARRDAARDQLATKTDWLLAAVVVGAVGAVLVAITIWVALRRWVTRPLASLGEETRTVRSGVIDHEVQVVGPPEITALGGDVEAMRRRLVGQLQQVQAARAQVEDARVQLETQAAELQRSNRDLEQFAYVASHDLQEPLRKVASFCQLLERRYKGQLDERADQYIAFAVDGAKRMQQLINDLLAFSRVGRLTGTRGEVALDDCLAAARRNLEAVIEDSGAEIVADPLPTVYGERALLTALLQNLVGNALKFRGAEPPTVRITAVQHGDEWEMSCADNGIGIEPQYADRIFVIFQRLHPKDEYEGTGIGLSMCKKIVEWHGGRIWLDTAGDDPHGTTFRWTLPVVEQGRAIMGDTAEPDAAPVAAGAASTKPAATTQATAGAAVTGGSGHG